MSYDCCAMVFTSIRRLVISMFAVIEANGHDGLGESGRASASAFASLAGHAELTGVCCRRGYNAHY